MKFHLLLNDGFSSITLSKRAAKKLVRFFSFCFVFLSMGLSTVFLNAPTAFANGNGTGLDRPCDSNVVVDDGSNTNTPGHVLCVQIIGAGNGDQVYASYALQPNEKDSNGNYNWEGHLDTFSNILPYQLDTNGLTSNIGCGLADGNFFASAKPSDNKSGMIDNNNNVCYTHYQNSNINGSLSQANTATMPSLRCSGLNVLMHDAAKKVNDGLTEKLIYCGTELNSTCANNGNLRAQGLFNNFGGGLSSRGDPFDSNGLNAFQIFCMGNNASNYPPSKVDLPTYNWCIQHYYVADKTNPDKNYCDFSFDSATNTTNPIAPPQNSPGFDNFTIIINPITNQDFTSLAGIVRLVTSITFAFIATIAGGVLFYAGFVWMTSQDEPDKIKKARSMILYTFIGIAVIAFSVIIIRLTALIINFNISPYL